MEANALDSTILIIIWIRRIKLKAVTFNIFQCKIVFCQALFRIYKTLYNSTHSCLLRFSDQKTWSGGILICALVRIYAICFIFLLFQNLMLVTLTQTRSHTGSVWRRLTRKVPNCLGYCPQPSPHICTIQVAYAKEQGCCFPFSMCQTANPKLDPL